MTVWDAVLNACFYLLVAIPIMVIGILIFGTITPYSPFQLLKEGANFNEPEKINQAKAVAYDLTGKMLGLGFILFCSTFNLFSLKRLLAWGMIGIIFQIIIYYLFVLCTPLKIQSEIAKGNVAVAFLASRICIAAGLLLGGLVSLT
ncbi:DUF350 domain-containing protein [Thermoflavimicrobium dichotomicum]|uniref:Putative membrane protein n=1 Tax=Thermoflavimicrobium dichotomicum TaxID=46223 RepID=A0A1I3JVD7_9BACL|nr:DUF350 domain-containing protein [Thermoflavimicrobium dichotomicum]SFI64221.1 putative membrane protein [Thermoflavimicrobium dichotomicum]